MRVFDEKCTCLEQPYSNNIYTFIYEHGSEKTHLIAGQQLLHESSLRNIQNSIILQVFKMSRK